MLHTEFQKRKKPYKAELQRLQEEGIIVPVKEDTQWVNSVVTTNKPDGSIRLCLDPNDPNKCLERTTT